MIGRCAIACLLAGAFNAGLVGEVSAQSFAEATRDPYQPSPATSFNGKSLVEMKAAVENEWDNIKFVTENGDPIHYQVVLQTDLGEIEIEFFPQVAPSHARSFIGLAKAGYYDGLIFHRCIPGFVIQGGCSKGDGTGGPGYCLKPEFSNKQHARGVLSMARATPVDSAGSQFFICTAAARSLDNKYTVFGQVTKGMDIVDQIVAKPRDRNDRPLEPVTIKKAVVKQS